MAQAPSKIAFKRTLYQGKRLNFQRVGLNRKVSRVLARAYVKAQWKRDYETLYGIGPGQPPTPLTALVSEAGSPSGDAEGVSTPT